MSMRYLTAIAIDVADDGQISTTLECDPQQVPVDVLVMQAAVLDRFIRVQDLIQAGQQGALAAIQQVAQAQQRAQTGLVVPEPRLRPVK